VLIFVPNGPEKAAILSEISFATSGPRIALVARPIGTSLRGWSARVNPGREVGALSLIPWPEA